MAIFNSLGSNFSWGQAWRVLIGSGNSESSLRTELATVYGGQPILTYKGRQALQLALQRGKLPAGSRVAINGFTCYVVYQAVQRAGFEPVCVDIAPGTAHFGIEQLQAAYAKTPFTAVIIQNTFGIPCDIASIQGFVREHKLTLIEDLAHSLGSIYADGREAGTVGEFAMLSFSQDKTLDNVAGGVCIDRQSAVIVDQPTVKAGQFMRVKRHWYPLLTIIIRATYAIQLGRVLHKLLKLLGLLSAPMDNVSETPQELPGSSIALRRWHHRDREFAHRRAISAVYQSHLPASIQLPSSGQPVYVRFPICVDKPADLLKRLRSAGFHLADTWYDAPLAPRRYMSKTTYQPGSCPESEKLVSRIVNLPVHQAITEAKAQQLCEVINTWLA